MAENPFRKSPAAGSSASGSPSPAAAGVSRSGAPGSETKLPLLGGTSPARSSSSSSPGAATGTTGSVSPVRRRELQGKAPKPSVIPEPEGGGDDDPHSSSSPGAASVRAWAPSYTRPHDSMPRRPPAGAAGSSAAGSAGAREGIGWSNSNPLSGTSHVSATSAVPASTSLATPESAVHRTAQQPQSPGIAAVHTNNAFGSLTSFGGSVGGGIPTWRGSTGGFGGQGQGSDEDTSRCFSVMSADPGSVTDTPSGLQPTSGGYGMLGDAMHTTAASMRRYSGNSMLTMPMGSDRERGTGNGRGGDDEDGGSLPEMLPETAANDMTMLPGLMSSPDPLNRTASPVPFVSKRVMPEWKDEDFQPAAPAAGDRGPLAAPKRAQIIAPGESPTSRPGSNGSSSGGQAAAAVVSSPVVVHVPPKRVAFAP